MKLLVCILACFGFACSICAIVHAQGCICDGQLTARFHDGDGDPLSWTYAEYLVLPGNGQHPARICYLREVENRTDNEVRDIHWPIAGYFRRFLQKGVKRSCPEVDGDPKPEPTMGGLFFGPSSQSYDTTVIEPKEGWRNQFAAGSSIREHQAIRNQFDLDNRGPEERGNPGVLTLWSTAKAGTETGSITVGYDLTNESDRDVKIRIDVFATDQMLKDMPIIGNPISIPARGHRTFKSVISGEVVSRVGEIVIIDTSQKNFVIDIAGLYTAKNANNKPKYKNLEPDGVGGGWMQR
jgi:hypothetical protein